MNISDISESIGRDD